MKTAPHRHPVVLAIALLCAAVGAQAANTMTASSYDTAKNRIAASYKADRAACDRLSGNAKDVCVEQAKGKQDVARAELEADRSGDADDRNKVAVARADAAYAVAKERCDDMAGNVKDTCVAEAKATHTKALADAKVGKTVGEARRDAMQDKREADYKVALQKCDALAGNAKSACANDAKARFERH